MEVSGNTPGNGNGGTNTSRFVLFALGALVALFGVTYGLLIDRINKQELNAAEDIATLREEIKTTKSDAKDAVAVATTASKDAVVAAAAALRDAANTTATSNKDVMNLIEKSLSARLDLLAAQLEKLDARLQRLSGVPAPAPD